MLLVTPAFSENETRQETRRCLWPLALHKRAQARSKGTRRKHERLRCCEEELQDYVWSQAEGRAEDVVDLQPQKR